MVKYLFFKIPADTRGYPRIWKK